MEIDQENDLLMALCLFDQNLNAPAPSVTGRTGRQQPETLEMAHHQRRVSVVNIPDEKIGLKTWAGRFVRSNNANVQSSEK